MHVVEVNEIGDLQAYRDVWARLLADTRGASFFQTLDWLTIYWRHFGRDQRLRTLLVYDHDERLAGIMPLAVRSMPTRAGAVRTLGYPIDGWGTSYGAIGPNRRTILSAGLRHLQHAVRDWDVLQLDWTPANHVDDVLAAFASLGSRPQCFSRPEISLVDVSQSWDDYWTTLHGKHRSNVRRAEKKLSALGDVDVRHCRAEVCPAQDVHWDIYAKCEQLSQRCWQRSSATGTTLTHERVRVFLRDVHDAAASQGAVAIHLLAVDGEPAAFSYNYVFQGAEFGLRMGYDPRFKHANPGTVLVHRMLQNVFASQPRLFDFGEGDSPYKHQWRTHASPSFRFCNYATTSLRAQALRWKRHWWGSEIGSSTSVNGVRS